MLAVLIGYNYNDNSIPGVGIDLFRAYSHFSDITSNITIISDLNYITLPDSIDEQITSGEIDPKILLFSTEVVPVVASERTDLRQKLSSLLRRSKRVAIYYSGHGTKGGILLPSGEEILETELRTLIINNSSVEELFLLFDCCNGGSMLLPYKLGNRFTLHNQYAHHFTSKKVLLICSSSDNEKALSSYKGSLFTHSFFSHLNNLSVGPAIFLPYMIEEIEGIMRVRGKQLNVNPPNIKVYSSFPIIPILWTWITNKYLEIDIDSEKGIIVITNK